MFETCQNSKMLNSDCSSFDFDVLRDLHDSVNDFLHSPTTKLEIVSDGHVGWANEVSEASLRMADSCAAAKDLLLLAKDHLHHLQSTFRRVSGAATDHSSGGNLFAPCRLPRKQLKKAILKRMQSLKGIRNEFFFATAAPRPEHANLMVVVNLLNEVRCTVLSMVKALSSLISMPREGKLNPVEAFKLRYLTRVDSLITWGRYDAAGMRSAAKRMEVVEELEGEMEQMLRRLIRTRALLLNVISSY